jgi:hypothetical protein
LDGAGLDVARWPSAWHTTAAADFHLPLPPQLDLAHIFCLEEQRVVGNDWVVRYANRAFQILPTPHAKRHSGPKARILVRETATEVLREQ